MADYTRELAADVDSPTTVDNQAKAEGGAEPPMVQVKHDYDPFGSSYDNWTTMSGVDIWDAWPATGNCTITEPGGGKLHLDSGGTGANRSAGARRNNVSYADADIVLYYNDTHAADVGGAGNGSVAFDFWRSEGNLIYLLYRARDGAGDHALQAYKIINGAATLLYSLADRGVEADIWFRITRVAATQTFTIYYALTDPIATPANWVEVYSDVVNDATHFNSSHLLYPIASIFVSGTFTLAAELDFYDQIAGAYERYNADSPDANIIDSANVGVGETYAFDAGVGSLWTLTGITTVEDGDGGTNKWKVGFSDAADGTGVTWDAAWRTIAEVNTNAGNGDYDGHRYLYVKWQGNSDGSQNVNATLFTITDRGISPRGQAHHDRMRRIKYNISRILP